MIADELIYSITSKITTTDLLPSAVTLGRVWGTPFGRDEKQPSALLRELERGEAIPALARRGPVRLARS